MVRRNMKHQGKFFLFNEKKRQYFHARGVSDDGSGPVAYTHWTPYFAGAMGFGTVKAARAMQNTLMNQREKCVIITRNREVVP